MGSGHLVRCGSLAEAWRRLGGEVILVTTAPQALVRPMAAAGVRVVALDARHPDPEDARATVAVVEAERAPGRTPWLALDGYYFDAAYRSAVRTAGARLLVLEDSLLVPPPAANAFLNQNLGAEEQPHAAVIPLLLLGTRYALLRREFASAARTVPDLAAVAHRILVTVGGADPANVTLTIVGALDQLAAGRDRAFEAVIVCGAVNPHTDAIASAAAGAGLPIRVVRDAGAAEMAALMAWADMAIAGGGTTCWELACMGVPALAITLAGNQRENVERLAAAGAALDVGRADHVSASGVAAALAALSADRPRRAQMRAAGQGIVDGRGADRVAALLSALSRRGPLGDAATIRRAEPRDLLPLWHLANDAGVRSNAFRPEPIPLDGHRVWYRARLASPSSRMWLMEIADTLVGQIRYERIEPEVAEINYSVVAAFRGRGVGTALLERTWEAACGELGVRTVRGITLADNAASGGAFLRAGFTDVGRVVMYGRACVAYERSLPVPSARQEGVAP